MNQAQILYFLREFISLGIHDYVITGGEPFLHNDVLQIVRYVLDQPGTSCTIASNAVHIAPQTLLSLSEICREHPSFGLRVSFDGGTELTHDGIRGKGSFAHTMQTLERASELEIPITGINSVLTNKIVSELDKLLSIAEMFHASDLTLIDLITLGRGTDMIANRLSLDEWLAVFQFQESFQPQTEVWINVRGPFDVSLQQQLGLTNGDPLINTLYLTASGQITFCYPFPENYPGKAGIFDQCLNWDKLLHEAEQLLSKCSHCPVRGLCHGILMHSTPS